MSPVPEPGVRRIQAAGLPDGGFAHGAVVPASATLFTAGISPLDDAGTIAAPGDLAAQTRGCLAALDEVLAAAGATREGLAKLTVYVVTSGVMTGGVMTSEADLLAQAWRIIDDWFDKSPAAIVLGVSALPYSGQLVEVEAVAAVHQ